MRGFGRVDPTGFEPALHACRWRPATVTSRARVKARENILQQKSASHKKDASLLTRVLARKIRVGHSGYNYSRIKKFVKAYCPQTGASRFFWYLTFDIPRVSIQWSSDNQTARVRGRKTMGWCK